MPRPNLIAYIRKHLKSYGATAIRERLLKDGLDPVEIDEALAEASRPPVRKPKRLAPYILGGAAALVVGLGYLILDSGPAKNKRRPDLSSSSGSLFHGRGYILKLSPGYVAVKSDPDASKINEILYICPKGTDPTHFIHEGLYGHFDILRLEVAQRRVPTGLITMEALQAWAKRQLQNQKAVYTLRELTVNGMPAFIVKVSEPFAWVKAYILGNKVFYTLYGGTENQVFTDLLASLIEISPTDPSGKAQ